MICCLLGRRVAWSFMGRGEPKITLYIMAAGRGRRLGQDKPRARLTPQLPLVRAVADALAPAVTRVIVVSRRRGDMDELGLWTIEDESDDLGPLCGLVTALDHALADGPGWILIAPCDMVGLRAAWVQTLWDAVAHDPEPEAVLFEEAPALGDSPGTGRRRAQPLFGLYHTSALPAARAQLASGQRAMWRLLERLRVALRPSPPGWDQLISVNRPLDLERARRAVDPRSHARMWTAINPATQQVMERVALMDEEALEDALAAAQRASSPWRAKGPLERAALIARLGRAISAARQELAHLITHEMGKPLKESLAEVDKSAWLCEHLAATGPALLAPTQVQTDASLSLVRYDPLGVILGIMPWNFPLWQVIRFAAPTWMAGNVILLKHSPNVPGCARAIAQLVEQVAPDQGLLQSLVIDLAQTARVIEDARVQGVSLTGSTRAGRAVGALAGAACKPQLLELGGSDPFIVLEDASLEQVIPQAVRARMLNGGQSCIAAKRHIVVASRYDEFVQGFERALRALKVGDPMDPAVDVGPMARDDLRAEVHAQVQRAVAQGATLRLGGQLPAGPGWFYPVTLLTEVEPGMATFDEEVFGPVASVIRARDEAHAVQLANASAFGLGASLWTEDRWRAMALAAELQVGAVAVNGIVKSDPRLPFGGVKASGLGRELGVQGLMAFVNVKSVWIG